MADWKKVGEFFFEPQNLEIRLLRGVIVGRDRNTTHSVSTRASGDYATSTLHTYTRDRVWVKTPNGDEQEVNLGTNTDIPVREGHEVSVWYAGITSPSQFKMVAFENNTTKLLYDYTKTAKDWGPRKVGLLELSAVFGGGWVAAYVFGAITHSYALFIYGLPAAVIYTIFRIGKVGSHVNRKSKQLHDYIQNELRGKV
jgi:hypothetical protein